MNKTTELTAIRDALLKCGITGDSLFARIREDIDRGLIREARSHLNFVDRINAAHAGIQARLQPSPEAGCSRLVCAQCGAEETPPYDDGDACEEGVRFFQEP